METDRSARACTRPMLALLLASAAGPAFAQAAATASAATPDQARSTSEPATPIAAVDAGPADGEIVVTAQRRSERLQNVGIAVTAFSGDNLRAQGITTSTEVARLSPGVTLSGTFGGQSVQFSIRGVTQSDFNDAIEAPVAVYVDDIYVASQQGQSVALFDIERVEALNGPQGTLFGRNATGGLVHFIVNKPKIGETSGFVQGSFARFNTSTLEGALNVPVGETVAVRASAVWNRNDPVWENMFPEGLAAGAPVNFGGPGVARGEDLGGQDSLSGRAQLFWEPTATFNLRVSGSATRQRLSTSPWASRSALSVVDEQNRVVGTEFASATETRAAIGPGGANFFDPTVLAFQGFLFAPTTPGFRAPGANFFGYVPVDIDERKLSVEFAREDTNKFEAYNGALYLNRRLGEIDLVSVTSYSKYRKSFLLDVEASPANVVAFGSNADTSTISQEIRLGQQESDYAWTAGFYHLDVDAYNAVGLLGTVGSAYSNFFGSPATGADTPSVFRLETYSTSIFGQGSYEFVPRWTAVLGLRAINERQRYDYRTVIAANLDDYTIDTGPGPSTYPAFEDKRSEVLWAGKAQLEFRPTSRLLLYVGVNRGVKGGSYNGQYFDGGAPISPDEIPYGAETLVSTEGGFKLTGPGGAYTLNVAAFHYDYSDYQSFNFVNLVGTVRNVDATTNGVEAAASVRLGGLRASVTGAYVDSEIKDFAVAPGVLRDTRPAYTPELSGNARLDYTVPRSLLDGELTLGAGIGYSSSYFHNARNFAATKVDGRTVVDINADWVAGSGFSIGGFIKNLFDERYVTVGLDVSAACGCVIEGYGQPVTYGMRAGYRF